MRLQFRRPNWPLKALNFIHTISLGGFPSLLDKRASIFIPDVTVLFAFSLKRYRVYHAPPYGRRALSNVNPLNGSMIRCTLWMEALEGACVSHSRLNTNNIKGTSPLADRQVRARSIR